MDVLRDRLGLVPVEYDTTRRADALPAERAADLMAAFCDPRTTAIMATIGGDDLLTVLPHLDADLVRAHPKSFFGYSDCTNLLNWLWNQGIVAYHGGSTMAHLARGGRPHPTSLESLRAALFDTGAVSLDPVPSFADTFGDWADPTSLEREVPASPEPGWSWHGPQAVVTGPTWGGNLEIVHWNLAAGRWIRPVEDYAGCVLLVETSEEMPPAVEVFRMLRNMGERGLLAQFPAIVVAKPKAWDPSRNESDEERARYRADQQEAVLRATDVYCPGAMVVLGPDFGHTDPQYVIPYGGRLTVDGTERHLTIHY